MKSKPLAAWMTRKEKTKNPSTHATNKNNVSNLADLIRKEGQGIYIGQRLVGITGKTVIELFKLGDRRKKKKDAKRRG